MNNEIDMLRKNVFDNLQAIEEKDKQLDKYKNVIDKIKEYVKEWRESDGSGSYGTLELLELLEEVNG